MIYTMIRKFGHTWPIYVSRDIKAIPKGSLRINAQNLFCEQIFSSCIQTNQLLMDKLDCIVKKKQPSVQQTWKLLQYCFKTIPGDHFQVQVGWENAQSDKDVILDKVLLQKKKIRLLMC